MNFKLLVVDDEMPVRRIVQVGFTSVPVSGLAWEVREAGTGRQALEAAAQMQPDLVLMDVRMPGLDGYETTRQLRAHPEQYGDPAVVIITAYGQMGETRARAQAAGADDYLPKPFEMDFVQLQQHLAALVRQRRDGGRRERGQSLIEFALVLPLLLLVVVGFVYLADLLRTWSALQSAAVSGARHAARAGDVDEVAAVVADSLSRNGVDPTPVSLEVEVLDADGHPKVCWGLCPVEFGDLIEVRLAWPFRVRAPGWSAQGSLPAAHRARADHGAWEP